LQKLFDELPPPQRDQAEVILRHVHSLACEQGILFAVPRGHSRSHLATRMQNAAGFLLSSSCGFRSAADVTRIFFAPSNRDNYCSNKQTEDIRLVMESWQNPIFKSSLFTPTSSRWWVFFCVLIAEF
jgi:hypothetical protein